VGSRLLSADFRQAWTTSHAVICSKVFIKCHWKNLRKGRVWDCWKIYEI